MSDGTPFTEYEPMRQELIKTRTQVAKLESQLAERDEAIKRVQKFPVMLRKMWSGGEVADWIGRALIGSE